MALPPDPRVVASLKRTSDRFNVFVVCSGILVLAGWIFNIHIFKSILPQWPVMRPVTAICFVLTGISLSLANSASNPTDTSKKQKTTYILAGIVIVLSLIEIIQYYAHLDLGIGNMLINAPPGTSPPYSNGMTLQAAFCFFSLGFTLIATRHGANKYLLQVCAVIVGYIGLVEILDYCFWAAPFNVLGFEQIGLLTAICFFFVSLSLLFSRPGVGWMSVVSSDSLGGRVVRKLLPTFLILLISFSELGYVAQQFNLINLETNLALSTVVTIVFLTFVMLLVARDLAKEDVKRRLAEQRTDELNRSLISRTEQLEESNDELEQIIKVTSHDLTEPVKTISTYSDLILTKYGDKLDENATTYFHFLRISTERTRAILKDVLTYGSVRKAGKLETCDCNKMVSEVLEDLKMVIESTGAKVTVTPLPTFLCYKNLKLVFHHMIHNAIKFKKADTHPEIGISCVSKDDKWHFIIADNGIGIEPQYFQKIFKLFQKLHPKHKFEGSGMGLALSKKIVGFHNGEIWVESAPNAGATFHFTLSKTLKSEKEQLD